MALVAGLVHAEGEEDLEVVLYPGEVLAVGMVVALLAVAPSDRPQDPLVAARMTRSRDRKLPVRRGVLSR